MKALRSIFAIVALPLLAFAGIDGYNTLALGYLAGGGNTNNMPYAYNSVILGDYALEPAGSDDAPYCDDSVAIGTGVGARSGGGISESVVVGAGAAVDTFYLNGVAIGKGAAAGSRDSSIYGVAIGNGALAETENCTGAIAIGFGAMQGAEVVMSSLAIGDEAMKGASNVANSVAIGAGAGMDWRDRDGSVDLVGTFVAEAGGAFRIGDEEHWFLRGKCGAYAPAEILEVRGDIMADGNAFADSFHTTNAVCAAKFGSHGGDPAHPDLYFTITADGLVFYRHGVRYATIPVVLDTQQ